MQISPAIGFLRRQTQHPHDRLIAVKNDADIRNALKCDSVKSGMQLNPLLKKRMVRQGAQGIHARENVRNMLPQVFRGEWIAVVAEKTACFPADDHPDTAPGGCPGMRYVDVLTICQE